MKKQYGITLIALVITIILLLILAGVVINVALRENGILKMAVESKEVYKKAELKEELEMKINELEIEIARLSTFPEILEFFKSKNITATMNGTNIIQGEYKGYEYIVKENKEVIIGNKLIGLQPTILIGAMANSEGEIQIQVIGNTEEGEITQIESEQGLETVKEENIPNKTASKTFKTTQDGTYTFSVKSTVGRIIQGSIKINNEVTTINVDSILEGVSRIDSPGIKKIAIEGKQEQYSLNVIIYNGNIKLDGNTNIIGSTLNSNIYEFGNADLDTANATVDARNAVVVKVNGNLKVDENVTLTSCKNGSGYGGPKGMIIYCTGNLTNNGTISMTARGARATGEDVYLWKNANPIENQSEYEFVPAVGGSGANARTYSSSSYADAAPVYKGYDGGVGTQSRSTGGGASGGTLTNRAANKFTASSGRGGNGTSYSGGTGGGGLETNYGGTFSAGAGSNNGGVGGSAFAARTNTTWSARGAGGGTGNPGGDGKYTSSGQTVGGTNASYIGTNGTGGLLTIYSKEFNNMNEINSNGSVGRIYGGSSGGGSVNIFANSITNVGTLTANGGIIAGSSGGGNGGNGHITIGTIVDGTYVEHK